MLIFLFVVLNFILKIKKLRKTQTTDPAFEATLGHTSAHSLATGPVIYDPFISPFGFAITPALSFFYYYK